MQYSIVKQEDGSFVTVLRPGEKPLTARSDHPNYNAIIRGLLDEDEHIFDLFDVALTVGTKFEKLTERVSVTNGVVYLDGQQIDNSLTEQILRFLEAGVEDWKPLVNFYENMLANPNPPSVQELYSFLGKNRITITEDGMILGYKGLTDDGDGFKSSSSGKAIVDGVVYEGQIPQDVGSVVEMPRNEVEYDPSRECGIGLHVGNHAYALGYARPGFFEVHVNPRDVVSVPDYGTKLRCCRYVIAKTAKDEVTEPVVKGWKPKPKPKTVPIKTAPKAKVNKGDIYRDRDPRRPRELKVRKVIGGVALVENLATGKPGKILAARLQSRFDRIRRGR